MHLCVCKHVPGRLLPLAVCMMQNESGEVNLDVPDCLRWPFGVRSSASLSPPAQARPHQHTTLPAHKQALQNLIDKALRKEFPTRLCRYHLETTTSATLVCGSTARPTSRCAQDGPGTVQLWFSVGAGLLVNQSSNVLLDGLSVDFDPLAHYQGTVEEVRDDGGSMIQAVVATDPGFLNPAVFDNSYAAGNRASRHKRGPLRCGTRRPRLRAYRCSWSPATAADGRAIFNVSRATLCKDLNYLTTDGLSCAAGASPPFDRRTRLPRTCVQGFRCICSTVRVRTRHTAIHGAPGFAITEYDGAHTYLNVSVGRRHVHVVSPDGTLKYDTRAMCVDRIQPAAGCTSLISSNNDALHSSG